MLKSLPGPNFSGVQRVKNRIAEIRRLVGDKNVSRGGSTFVEILEEKERDYEKQAAKEILKNGKSLTGRKGIVNLADHTEESNFALIEKVLERKCRKYGVKESLVKAVMEMESGGNPKAVSKAGAMGLMQLMPSTA
ncbi:MAG: transglycosylase SLT domain-containing protein, partial [Thermovirga sp.]|nr:transglycosylase SLT domain-containing protein [Thermovirga sp.]